jgi:hypothetical protein
MRLRQIARPYGLQWLPGIMDRRVKPGDDARDVAT